MENTIDDSIDMADKTSVVKYVGIGVAAAVSGLFLRWFEGLGDTSALIRTIVHTIVVLFPAAITYYMLSREQDRKLNQVIATLRESELQIKDLKRVTEVEKNYHANDQLLRLERKVIEATGSSMHEVAELVAEFDDKSMPHVRLKERFKVHAKSIVMFHQAFQVEVESNQQTIARIEHEFSLIPHDERDQLHYSVGRERTERAFKRHNLQDIVDNLGRISETSKEMGLLADQKTKAIVQRIDSGSDLEEKL